MKNYFIEEMLNIVDLDRKISHEKLAEKTEDTLMDDTNYKKLKFPADVRVLDSNITEICKSLGRVFLRSLTPASHFVFVYNDE